LTPRLTEKELRLEHANLERRGDHAIVFVDEVEVSFVANGFSRAWRVLEFSGDVAGS
jgi:hypothetical protein